MFKAFSQEPDPLFAVSLVQTLAFSGPLAICFDKTA